MVGPLAANPVGVAFGIIWLIVIASWALMFAVLIGVLITVTVLRGSRERKRRAAPAAPAADPDLPARLAEIRRADPHFDEQLLLEAAQMACLVAFAMMATGDEQLIRHMTAPPFWSTFYGKYLKIAARDARLQRGRRKDAEFASSRAMRIPVDYQATVPELITLELGPQQLARVRISFNQLRVMMITAAASTTAMASAKSLSELASSFGGAVGERLAESGSPAAPRAGLSWVSWAGHYDLVFVRPDTALTDPGAAVATRTCTRCGAAYRSELDTDCGHCQAQRPLAWGEWRLAELTPVT
jgi:hypothetical protein